MAAVMSATLVVVGLIALPFLAAPAYAVTGTTGPVNVTVSPTSNLTSGQTIAIDATTTSGTISDILVHVCDTSITPVNQFKFTSDVYCPNVTLTSGDAGNIVDQTLANTTTGHANFKVGTGTANWIDGFANNPHTLTCDSTHSCLLVMQFSSNVAPGTFYFSTPLTYAAPLAQPSAPVLSSATAGDTVINAAWTAPSNTGNGTIDQYTVTATRTGGTADPASPHVVVVSGTTLSTTIPSLVNGAVYDVSVVARNSDGATGHFSSVPSNVISATPAVASRFVRQPLDVTRPNGALVLTQACVDANPYPVDGLGQSVAVYPTTCPQSVSLGVATLITSGPGAGQYFQASGPMNQVTIVDTRDTDPGWTAQAAVSNFTDALSHTFSGNDLGFTPVVTDRTGNFSTPDGDYAMRVVAGGSVAPGLAGGLVTPRTIADGGHNITEVHPPNTGGLGISHLDASLHLLIPIFAHSGHYTAVLTITAI